MSGWGSFTHLWCEYGFTLQQDPCCSGMLLWILTVFASNKFIFFFAFVSNTSYFFPSTCSLSPTLLRSRAILPYWFCEVQWPEHGSGTRKGVGSIPAKLQVFIGLSECGIICLQGYTTNHNIFCFVTGVLSVRRHCKLEAQGKSCQMHYAFADVGENIRKPHVCISDYCLQILCFEIRCKDN